MADLAPGSGVHISPDSRHVAFHKPDEIFAPLYVVDLDENGAAAAVRKVAQTNSFGLVGASWSADGTYLYTTAINKTPQRVMRARVSNGELEDLFDGATPVVAPDGHRVFYRKGLGVSPLFVRSLDGDIATNAEEQLVPGCVMTFGIVPTSRGVHYVACDEHLRTRYAQLLRVFFSPVVQSRSRAAWHATDPDRVTRRPASGLSHSAARQWRTDARHLSSRQTLELCTTDAGWWRCPRKYPCQVRAVRSRAAPCSAPRADPCRCPPSR